MNYRVYELIAIAFSVYFFYAAYMAYPSKLGNFLRFFGLKKRMRPLDQIYNVITAIFLMVIVIFLELKYRTLS